jgi:hypothetical protein
MGDIFITPQWFFGYDVILEVLFAVVTLLVCYYAYKVYKLSGQNHLRLFSWAFLFIGVSYIAQSILNFLILDSLDDDVSNLIKLQSVYHLNLFGIYFHTILFIIGLIILVYTAMKIDNVGVFVLLLGLIFPVLYFTPYKTFTLYLFSTVILGFIAYYYLKNYWNNRKPTSLIVSIAMIFLFFSYFQFIFATQNSIYYVIGHFMELAAYALILINLGIILRVGKQKHGKKA